MENRISRIIIVAGGSAGWLSAAVIAAEHRIDSEAQQPFEVLLIESPDIPTVKIGSINHIFRRTVMYGDGC